MLRRLLPWPVGAFILLGATAARSQEEAPPPRPAPAANAPVVVEAPLVSPLPPGSPYYWAPGSPYYRPSRYDVWANYSVDRSNQFRPRVVIAPYGGAYYYYDGSPYYYVPLNSRQMGTTLMGTPYR